MKLKDRLIALGIDPKDFRVKRKHGVSFIYYKGYSIHYQFVIGNLETFMNDNSESTFTYVWSAIQDYI